MPGQFPEQSSVPAPIFPGIELLVHRRATEIATERPRRQLVMASSMGGVAVAAACAVLVLVLGSPSGSGLLSPQRAVAAVAESLESNGVLHWVRTGEAVRSEDRADGGAAPSQPESLETRVEDAWVDLESDESHHVTTVTLAQGGSVKTIESWQTSNVVWVRSPGLKGDAAVASRLPRQERVDIPSVADEIRLILDRARRGQADIADAGASGGTPLVVVTDRIEGQEQRVWVTRDPNPSVARLVTVKVDDRTGGRVTTTMDTQTWEVLPRTAETLRHVEVPPDVTGATP
jgi:hypothetical protein